jgi:hypothetical protein
MTLPRTAAIAALISLGSFAPLVSAKGSNQTLPIPVLMDFDDDGVLGGLFRPAISGPRSQIAVYLMHAEQDYTSFSACTELPKRGFTVFCANNDASKSGYMSDLTFEDMMTEGDQGMSYLRNLTEIERLSSWVTVEVAL